MMLEEHALKRPLEHQLLRMEDMTAVELTAERHRLISELLGSDSTYDAFERAAILEVCKSDSSNPMAVRLTHVEEALHRLGIFSSVPHREAEDASASASALESMYRALSRLVTPRSETDGQ